MIRLAQKQELPRLLEIYEQAKVYMRRTGNPTQWAANYPGREQLLADMDAGQLYVLEEKGRLCACFLLAPGPDPTYAKITDGAWGYSAPYGVLHRVASDGSLRGVLKQCVDFAALRFHHLRIDTHADNAPMQRALAREGFCHRGTIFTHDGTPRLAYDRLK